LRQEDHPGVTIVSDRIGETIDELRAQPGKDIWLYGGGQLFHSLMDLGYVDTIEPAIVPVVIGDGIPMFPRADMRHSLELTNYRLYEKTGIILLEYAVKKS
jgi:dihydrofolate reductase